MAGAGLHGPHVHHRVAHLKGEFFAPQWRAPSKTNVILCLTLGALVRPEVLPGFCFDSKQVAFVSYASFGLVDSSQVFTRRPVEAGTHELFAPVELYSRSHGAVYIT